MYHDLFARAAIAMIRGRGRPAAARQFAMAESRTGAWQDSPFLWRALGYASGVRMAGVPAIDGDISDGDQALWHDASTAFLQDVRAASVVGRIAGAHRTRFNRTSIENTTHTGSGWVQEGHGIVVRRSIFETVAALPSRKVAALTVASSEFSTSPIAERNIGAELRRAVAEQLDTTFCGDSAGSASAPAGILNNAVPVAATGATAAAHATDLASMIATMTAANVSMRSLVWIVPPAKYALLRLQKVADADGTIGGFPVIVSTATTKVILLATDHLVIAEGDTVELSTSASGTIEQDDSPTGVTVGTPTALSASPISLFQEDAIALRSALRINWTTAGPQSTDGSHAVVVLEP